MYISNFEFRLNLALVSMVTIKNIKNVRAQFKFFYIIYINHNYKLLTGIKKLAIF